MACSTCGNTVDNNLANGQQVAVSKPLTANGGLKFAGGSKKISFGKPKIVLPNR